MKRFVLIAGITFLICAGAMAQNTQTPPDKVTGLLLNLTSFERNISRSDNDVTIYVIGDPAIAEAFKKSIGKKIGKSALKEVKEGDSLPDKKPTILYIGDSALASDAIDYSRSKKILSMTGVNGLVATGVTLGIEVSEEGKTEMLLNLTSSAEEGLDWNPTILSIAKTVK